MFKLLRMLYWELANPTTRFHYTNAIIRQFPGNFGVQLRKKMQRKHFKSCGKELMIDQGVRFRNIQKIAVGDYCGIGVDNFFQAAGGINIGDYVVFGPSVKIWTTNHNYTDTSKPIIEQGYEHKEVNIGNNVWIGANCFIMPGAEIGDYCIISAGSVVGGKTIPPYTILAGNPARKIGTLEKQED